MRAVFAPPTAVQRFVSIAAKRIGPVTDGKYRHWDTLRHLEPPEGLTHDEWWFGIKTARQSLSQPLPLAAKDGEAFRYVLTDIGLRMLHEIDRDASGTLRATSPSSKVTNPHTKDAYLFKSVVEEAITSSQLEGASTTPEVAKDMITKGRAPRDRSERMIYNNYKALLHIREIAHQPLTKKILFELHRILTDGTLDEPTAAGRLRSEDEHICVSDEFGTVLHDPPPASQLVDRLDRMCEFANSSTSDPFIHPVLRAIVLHFWLAYDHPFVDGNGRTARALFYWSMSRQGYWLAEFLSISRILKKGPARYSRSFLYTETDDNDATYFILAQLRVITRAIKELHEYLARKAEELSETARLVRQSEAIRAHLNHRQIALINHALKDPNTEYTFESHRTSHNVAYGTARTDLLALADHGLLVADRIGRMYTFRAPPDLHQGLARFSSSRLVAR